MYRPIPGLSVLPDTAVQRRVLSQATRQSWNTRVSGTGSGVAAWVRAGNRVRASQVHLAENIVG
ncbi:hypothetical protein D3C76_1456570 [compost metagenome]